jgi:hypothetical protein
MSQKQRMLGTLGEARLTVPALINRGLAANDRAKYYFSLLQFAAANASRPAAERPDLARERVAAGEADAALDAVVGATRLLEGGRYAIPGAPDLFARLGVALQEMLEPLAIAGEADAAAFRERLEQLCRESWTDADGAVPASAVARAASGARDGADSLHLLVMDLHKALNRLQATYATETVSGARAYLLAPEDRPLVAAFMRGIQRTRALKFDHPGLDTTATRSGARLLLQNDIGTTDAHVLVVGVEGLSATLTYTDVHLARLVFFQSLFTGWAVTWSDTLSRSDSAFEDGIYHLSVGSFQAPTREALEAYLEFLASRLVFLIDWNRARKRLRLLLGKKDAIALLRWAARQDLGHMAFLRIGGERAVFGALASLGRAPATFGARLDDILGRDTAIDFLRFVFRTASEALREGRPESLIADEIRAELLGSFLSARQAVLDLSSEQVALAIEIAAAVRDGLAGTGSFAQAATRSRLWERRGDELVVQARELGRRSEQAGVLSQIVAQGDDAVDALEDAAFHLPLLRAERIAAEAMQPLSLLAEIVLSCAQEYLKAVEGARDLGRGSPRTDVQEFLQAIHRIVDFEQRGDEAERAVHVVLASRDTDARDLFVIAEVARGLETATDSFLHSALALRDHVLGSVMAV